MAFVTLQIKLFVDRQQRLSFVFMSGIARTCARLYPPNLSQMKKLPIAGKEQDN